MATAPGPGLPAAERVGILGGTFDPVHVGHVVAAVDVRHALALDRVLLVVGGDPWQKRGEVVASASDRLAMARAACDGIEGVEASDCEVRRPGPTYTADTLRELAAPGRELFLVVGADVARRMDTWVRLDEVQRQATLVVVSRAGESPVLPARLGSDFVGVEIPRLDVSSTDLRARRASGRPIDGLVPPAVVRVITERALYTSTR